MSIPFDPKPVNIHTRPELQRGPIIGRRVPGTVMRMAADCSIIPAPSIPLTMWDTVSSRSVVASGVAN